MSEETELDHKVGMDAVRMDDKVDIDQTDVDIQNSARTYLQKICAASPRVNRRMLNISDVNIVETATRVSIAIPFSKIARFRTHDVVHPAFNPVNIFMCTRTPTEYIECVNSRLHRTWYPMLHDFTAYLLEPAGSGLYLELYQKKVPAMNALEYFVHALMNPDFMHQLNTMLVTTTWYMRK